MRACVCVTMLNAACIWVQGFVCVAVLCIEPCLIFCTLFSWVFYVITFQVVCPMTTARDGACLAAMGNHLMALGGINGPAYLNSAEIYDPHTDKWQVSSLPQFS